MRDTLTVILIAVGAVFATLFPLADAARACDMLILIFSVLAGLLAQMIALTAIIFEPGRMSSESIRRVGVSIDGLQKLNIGLFAIYLGAIGGLLAIKLIEPYAWIANLGWHYLDVSDAVRALTGAALVLSIVRTFKTLAAVRALQAVRISVQIDDAGARERQTAAQAADALKPVADQGGAKYGAVRAISSDKHKRQAKA